MQSNLSVTSQRPTVPVADVQPAPTLLDQLKELALGRINDFFHYQPGGVPSPYADLDALAGVAPKKYRTANPYARSGIVDGKEATYVAIIDLFAPNEVQGLIDAHGAGVRPTAANVGRALEVKLRAMAASAGFEVVAIATHADGTPSQVGLRDPVYVAQATSSEEQRGLETLRAIRDEALDRAFALHEARHR